jgi:hypothetical protein
MNSARRSRWPARFSRLSFRSFQLMFVRLRDVLDLRRARVGL